MRHVTLVITAALALALSACAPAAEPERARGVAPAQAPSPGALAEIVAAPVAGPITVRATGPESLQATARPARLVVERLGIDMRVAGVGVEPDGEMELPDSAEVAGWFRASGNPGGGPRVDQNAVIAAHVDDAVVGLGPFARLREARVGDAVTVRLDTGEAVAYRVARVEQTAKRDVDLGAAFASSDGALVLVTCGGRWNADVGHYEDNVLVWAYPEGASR